MPTEQNINPPFPNGAYGTYNSEDGTRGIGPVYVDGNIPEWSASASPYYTIGQAVKHKGLVYKLNYNWDGTTVGSPSNQVDANGIRVWTLLCTNYPTQNAPRIVEPLGYIDYKNNKLKQSTIKPYWQAYHGIAPAHDLFERALWKDDSGQYTQTLLSLACTVEKSPLKSAQLQPGIFDDIEVQSFNFNSANNIDSKLFGIVTSSCVQPTVAVGAGSAAPSGIFDFYKNFKKNYDLLDIGTLYYEKSYSYTLAITDWRLHPEYDATAYGPSVTVNWSYTNSSGNTQTVNDTYSTLKMIFRAETFLGRTYTGAYRVYVKNDSVSAIR
jgi:hypothetical protein